MLTGPSGLGAVLLFCIVGCGVNDAHEAFSEPNPPPGAAAQPSYTAGPLPDAAPTAPSNVVDAAPPPTASSGPPPTTPPAGYEYDLNIGFAWPDTEPSSGRCEAGTYTGTFQCDLAFIPGFPPTVFTGPLTFNLTPSPSGEFLELNGRFDAVTNGLPFGAELVGQLDCGTKKLEATLNNGIYGTAPFTGTFFGNLEGTLDPLTGTLTGTWSLTAGTPTMPQVAPCIGVWTVVRQP